MAAIPWSTILPGNWYEVPNSRLDTVLPSPVPPGITGPIAIMQSWSGGAYDTTRDRLMVWGGGHQDYGGNELYAFDVMAPTPAWSRIFGPSASIPAPGGAANEAYTDGNPASRHTYDGLNYLPTQDCFWACGGSLYSGSGGASNGTWQFSLTAGTWQRRADIPAAGYLENVSAYDPTTGHVFLAQPSSGFYEFNPTLNTWTNRGNAAPIAFQSGALDYTRRKFIVIGNFTVYSYDLNTFVRTTLGTTGTPEPSQYYPGFVYDPVANRMVAWGGGIYVYSLNLDTNVWTRHSPTNGVVPSNPSHSNGNAPGSRWQYIPSKNAYIGVNAINENVWIYRLTAGGGGGGATISIPLTIRELGSVARTSDSVSTGVPLPIGTATAGWSLLDGSTEIPVQTTALAGRVPWLLVDCQTTLAAGGTKALTLQNVTATVLPSPAISKTENSTTIVLNTGPLEVTVRKDFFNLFELVKLNAVTLFTSASSNVRLTDHAGTVFNANAIAPTSVVMEDFGSIRATIRADGLFSGWAGMGYTVRISVYAGKSYVKFDYTLRNSLQNNERHIHCRAAVASVGSAATVRATRSGSIVASGWGTGVVCDLVTSTESSGNNGFALLDLSHRGATFIIDFANSAAAEITRIQNSFKTPLMALAAGSWYAQYGELSTRQFSTIADESAAYTLWGWAYTSAQVPSDPSKPDYDVSWLNFSVHDDLEADDTWQNLLMYIRGDGQQVGYFHRARAWARYYKWEYTHRTDGFNYAWDSSYENPATRITRTNISVGLTATDNTYIGNALTGKCDIHGSQDFGGDHMFGWGLVDWYYITGDRDGLDAAQDLAKCSEVIFNWRVAGVHAMAYTGARQGARNLLLNTRVYESTLLTRWQTDMNHMGDLWIQSPDWTTVGTAGMYCYGDFTTNSLLGGSAYTSGARGMSPFQAGCLSAGLDRYYAATGNTTVRSRLIAMANWWYAYGLDAVQGYSGSEVFFNWPTTGQYWHNYFPGGPPTFFDPIPSMWATDIIVRGHLLQANPTLLANAKLHWDRSSKAAFGVPITVTAGPTQVGRFVNKNFSSGNNLYVGNGDLTYTILLFKAAITAGGDTTPPAAPTGVTVSPS